MDYEYWGGGNELDRIVDPRGYSITLDYDSSERITSISYNAYRSSKTTWTYTYNSGNTVVADPLGYDTTYYYDGNGRVTETVNAEGDSVGSTWDANNNQTAILDPTGQVTTLVYGSLNNLTSRQNPDLDNGDPGAATTYEYADPNHPYEPSKKTDPSGNTVAYSYNVNGQLASKAGSASDGTATGTFTYAYQGDPNGSSGTVDCGAMTGQLCSKTDARGNTTTFSYDTDGNVTTITPPGPVGQKTYTYDALSRVKTITDGNGSKLTVTYDGADRPISVTYADTGATVPYAYDAAGNLLTRNDSVGGQTTWEYDGYNRITKVKQSGKPAITYSYDAAGNLTTESGPAGTTAYTYDTANQIDHITKPNNKTYAYVYQDGRP